MATGVEVHCIFRGLSTRALLGFLRSYSVNVAGILGIRNNDAHEDSTGSFWMSLLFLKMQ